MRYLFQKLCLITLLLSVSQSGNAGTPTGVLLDIFEIQATALKDTSEQTILSLSENAMANFENVYAIIENDENFGAIDFSATPTALTNAVDLVYEHPVMKTRLGLTSALGSITKAVDTAEAIQMLASIPGIAKDVFDIAENAQKAVTELNELIKGGKRAILVRHLLDYGAGRRAGKLQAMLDSIDKDAFWNIWNFINALKDVNDTNQKVVEDAMDLLTYMTKAEVAKTYSDNLRNGVWAKVTLQDYIVRKWHQAGIISDSNSYAFHTLDSYAIDPDDGYFGFSPKVFTRPASQSYDLFTSSDIYDTDYSSYVSDNDFELEVTFTSPNTYQIRLPDAIADQPVQGKATEVVFAFGGTDIVATYPDMISASEVITGTADVYQSITINLSQQEATKLTQEVGVTVRYADNTSFISSDYLVFYPQVNNLELIDLPTEWRSDSFDLPLQFCGDEAGHMTLYFKGVSNSVEDSVSYQLNNPEELGSDCRKYVVEVNGWDIYRYTGKNTDVSLWATVANQASQNYTKNLLDTLDIDNDKMPDSWEMEHFGSLSEGFDDDFDDDGDSNGYEYYHLTDPTKEGFDGITEVKVFKPVQLEDGTWDHECRLAGTYWSHAIMKNSCNSELYSNTTITGNFTIESGTLDLRGKRLTVEGNLYQKGGFLKVNNGTLHVKGDYLLASDDIHAYGRLEMVNTDDRVKVEGDFLIDSSAYPDAHSYFSAGEMDIKGDFTQRYSNYQSDSGSFYTSGTHKVVLSGNAKQTVSISSSSWSSSHFNVLEITNSSGGVEFVTRAVVTSELKPTASLIINSENLSPSGTAVIQGVWQDSLTLDGQSDDWVLQQDQTLHKDLHLNSRILNLNGHTLIIEGNLYQKGGFLKVNNGTLHVKGDYLLANDDIHAYGRLEMVNTDDRVKVEGDFLIDSSAYPDAHSYFSAGEMDIKGDFTQRYSNYQSDSGSFYTSGTHKVVLSGNAKQTVNISSSSWSSSHFNVLEITNSSSGGVEFISRVSVTSLFEHNSIFFTLADVANSNFIDFDNDGFLDYIDGVPTDPKENIDSDKDGTGDNSDLDDDNDGLPDTWELANGFNPFDENDANLDSDGDGKTNLEEYTEGTDPKKSNNVDAAIIPIIMNFLLE